MGRESRQTGGRSRWSCSPRRGDASRFGTVPPERALEGSCQPFACLGTVILRPGRLNGHGTRLATPEAGLRQATSIDTTTLGFVEIGEVDLHSGQLSDEPAQAAFHLDRTA